MLGFKKLFKAWQQMVPMGQMTQLFYFFAINHTYQKIHMQLIVTIECLDTDKRTNWHKLFEINKSYAIYIRGSSAI